MGSYRWLSLIHRNSAHMEAWFGVYRWLQLIVHCRHDNLQRSFTNTGNILLLKYYVFILVPVSNPKSVSIKYRQISLQFLLIISYLLITIPNACNYFHSAGHTKWSCGPEPVMRLGSPALDDQEIRCRKVGPGHHFGGCLRTAITSFDTTSLVDINRIVTKK